jgi:hypothetical protein
MWASNTAGRQATRAVMKADGNFVVDGPAGQLWASNTPGATGASLVMQDDGNLVIYLRGTPMWASNTYQADQGGPPTPVPVPGNSDAQFGQSSQYDHGVQPAVAVNSKGVVVEVHQSQSHDTLWCHTGAIRGGILRWNSGSVQYDDGVTPSVAFAGDDKLIEVHKSPSHGTLWYHVGTLQRDNTVKWGPSRQYGEGVMPRIAVGPDGMVVEVHRAGMKFSLYCCVGTFNGDQIAWGSSRQFNEGDAPTVTVTASRQVVEVHKSQAYDNLWYHVGMIQGDKIEWGPGRECGDGKASSLTSTGGANLVEVHQAPVGANTLWSRVGTIAGDAIDWSGSSRFSAGITPSVACTAGTAVQVHQSENSSTLWSSTSALANRASWMQKNFAELRDKSLKQIAIPGSHDAGMYTGNDIFGRTQDLSIYQQLQGGIRYLDLRVWNLVESGFLKIYHTGDKIPWVFLTGPSLQEVLDDVKRFLKEGHKELIILKFSKLKDFAPDTFEKQLVPMIQNTLGEWLIERPADPTRRHPVEGADCRQRQGPRRRRQGLCRQLQDQKRPCLPRLGECGPRARRLDRLRYLRQHVGLREDETGPVQKVRRL